MKKMCMQTENGFVFNDANQRLEAYEFINAQVNFAEQTALVTCKLAGKECTIEHDKLEVYANEECFNGGHKKEPIEHDCRACFWQAYGFYPKDNQAWIFEHGKAQQLDVTNVEMLIMPRYNRAKRLDERTFYASAEDVYLSNDYVVADAEGNETVHVCAKNKLALNEEQAKAAKLLEQAFDACHESGLILALDEEDYKIRFIRKDKTEDWSYADDLEDSINVDDILPSIKVSGRVCAYYPDGGVRVILK